MRLHPGAHVRGACIILSVSMKARLSNHDIAVDLTGLASTVSRRHVELRYFLVALSNGWIEGVCAAEQTAAIQAPRLQPSLEAVGTA